MKKLVLLFFCCFISFSVFAQTPLPPEPPVPCKVSECTLPSNFDWIIACCADSEAKKEQMKADMQDMIHGEQQINYRTWQFLKEGVVTPETYQKVLDYLAWHERVTTTRQVKDWPMDELTQRNIEAENLVIHDVKKSAWKTAVIKGFWFAAALACIYFLVAGTRERYKQYKSKQIITHNETKRIL